jgi:hypothetical protein
MTDGILTGLYAGEDVLKLEPPRASLDQLQLTNRLEMIRVERDVLGVVERLRRIDPGLKLLFDKRQNIFLLYHEGLNERGEMVESFVGAYTELDQRLVNLIERIDRDGRGRHDLQRELDRLEREQDALFEAARAQRLGDSAERLAHALRRDLGLGTPAVHMSGSKGTHRARAERKRKARRK